MDLQVSDVDGQGQGQLAAALAVLAVVGHGSPFVAQPAPRSVEHLGVADLHLRLHHHVDVRRQDHGHLTDLALRLERDVLAGEVELR